MALSKSMHALVTNGQIMDGESVGSGCLASSRVKIVPLCRGGGLFEPPDIQSPGTFRTPTRRKPLRNCDTESLARRRPVIFYMVPNVVV